MKTLMPLACLSLALFSFVGCKAKVEPASPTFADISVEDAAELIANDKDVVVLDIRTPAEYAAGHIAGAVLVDFKAANFADELKKLDRNTTYLMHCRSGNRSGRAMPTFKELGFQNIQHLKAGMNGWTAAGKPIEK